MCVCVRVWVCICITKLYIGIYIHKPSRCGIHTGKCTWTKLPEAVTKSSRTPMLVKSFPRMVCINIYTLNIYVCVVEGGAGEGVCLCVCVFVFGCAYV